MFESNTTQMKLCNQSPKEQITKERKTDNKMNLAGLIKATKEKKSKGENLKV